MPSGHPGQPGQGIPSLGRNPQGAPCTITAPTPARPWEPTLSPAEGVGPGRSEGEEESCPSQVAGGHGGALRGHHPLLGSRPPWGAAMETLHVGFCHFHFANQTLCTPADGGHRSGQGPQAEPAHAARFPLPLAILNSPRAPGSRAKNTSSGSLWESAGLFPRLSAARGPCVLPTPLGPRQGDPVRFGAWGAPWPGHQGGREALTSRPGTRCQGGQRGP